VRLSRKKWESSCIKKPKSFFRHKNVILEIFDNKALIVLIFLLVIIKALSLVKLNVASEEILLDTAGVE